MRPENVAAVRQQVRTIERIGGHVLIAPPDSRGGVLVTLLLPAGYVPEQFFPGLPFFPV